MPKKGRIVRRAAGDALYAPAIALTLQKELGETHRAVKILMRWTGACERTVKNWLAGSAGPSGENLVALLRHSDAVLDAVLELSGREEMAGALTLSSIRDTLVDGIARIDGLMQAAGGESEPPR
jgi:hypothetical protein